ncbi:hypothetical protein [Acetivibrio cellulolyticus]|uniref:hypothetical protein n=1 Tax=Acetivibrio cellulolyticus TaxID=35830 RepID=UPI0001E2C228|nr:hypothetical protein [Acetivibrio cellulolyticus]
MNSKKFIFILIAILVVLILISYFYYPIINYTYSSLDIVKTVQYDPRKIKGIEVFPLETDGIKELDIKDSQKIEEFAGFINSLRFRKLREAGLIGGETPQIMLVFTFNDGTKESLDIRYAKTRGIINEIMNDSYLLIEYDRNPYRCVNFSYEGFEDNINKFIN